METMKTAITLALAATLACGCGALPRKEPPPKPFIATKWVVKLELPIEGEQPWFRFGDGRMEGYGGCNKVVANFVQDAIGSRFIAIRRMDRGTRACEPGNQAAEQRVLEVLQAASSYTITVDEMVMSGSSGTLKFKSDPPAEVPK
jgi:heat shock protein HslJ